MFRRMFRKSLRILERVISIPTAPTNISFILMKLEKPEGAWGRIKSPFLRSLTPLAPESPNELLYCWLPEEQQERLVCRYSWLCEYPHAAAAPVALSDRPQAREAAWNGYAGMCASRCGRFPPSPPREQANSPALGWANTVCLFRG